MCQPKTYIEPEQANNTLADDINGMVIRSSITVYGVVGNQLTSSGHYDLERQLQAQEREPDQARHRPIKVRLPCKMCPRICRSRHEFYRHVRKHEPQCPNCNLKFDSWIDYEDHLPHCGRRFGLVIIPERVAPARPKKLPFRCPLCKRRYERHQHLLNHQIQRCPKRYQSDAWIVKI